jgi:hypothetical protein
MIIIITIIIIIPNLTKLNLTYPILSYTNLTTSADDGSKIERKFERVGGNRKGSIIGPTVLLKTFNLKKCNKCSISITSALEFHRRSREE